MKWRYKAEMDFKIYQLIFLMLILTVIRSNAQWDNSTEVKGLYLGQKPPGPVPELFAPDLLNAEHGYHSSLIFSPDLNEAIWSPMDREHHLMYSRMTDSIWTTPAEFDVGFSRGIGDATFSQDGKRIYFLSFQPPDKDAKERERIWYVQRTGDGWKAPGLIDQVILEHPTHWTFSLARNHNLYFTSEIKGVRGEQDIYIARFDGEKYLSPQDIGLAINSDGRDLTPFIDPEERYIIFSRISENTRKADLFISYNHPKLGWTEAISLGEEINSEGHDLCPAVTPDQKYIFYIRQWKNKSRIFWVEANIINAKNPK